MKYIPHVMIIISTSIFAVFVHSHPVAVLLTSLSLLILLGIYIAISKHNDYLDDCRLQIMAIRAQEPYRGFHLTCDGKERA